MGAVELSKNYIENKTQELVWGLIEKYIKSHSYELRDMFEFCGYNEDLQLDDIIYRTVYFYDMPKTMFKVSMLIEAIIDVEHYYRNDNKIEERSLWFQIVGETDINKKLSDFKVLSLERLESITKFKCPLSRSLCPIIHRDEYEEEATKFLKQFYPEALSKPIKIDPMIIVEKMKLNYIEENITSDNSIFGQIYFFKTQANLYDKTNSSYYSKEVTAGTIVVDPDSFFLYNEGSKNNTIIHECIHWWKHRKTMYLQHMINKKTSHIDCDVVGVEDDDTLLDKKFMEIQANALAPRVLMPYNTFKQYALKTIDQFVTGNPGVNVIDIMEDVIDSCSKHFGVSRLSAKIRLVDIGIYSAIGTYNYVDGHYVRPHSFASGSLDIDETFTISYVDAIILSLTNNEIMEMFESHKIYFVENHFVINSDEAITRNINGRPILTEEARLNMDKYCLKFKMTPLDVRFKSNDIYLNRDKNSKIKFKMDFPQISGKDLSIKQKLSIIMAEERKNIKELITLPQDYLMCLETLKNNKNMTATDIADEIGIDDRIVRRMFSGERDGSIILLTLILHVLGCEPDIAEHVIKLSPFKVDSKSEVYIMCKFFINNMHNQDIEEIKKFISVADFIPEKEKPNFIS